MPDPAAPPAPPPPPTPDPSLFAGKFQGPEALETGIRELRTKAGLADYPKDKPLVGKGGIFADHIAGETYYKELEQMQGRLSATPKPAAPTPSPAPLQVTAPAADDADIATLLTKAGVKGDELSAEWEKSGKLTDEQYTKLKTTGFPKPAVDAFMRGQQATAKLGQVEMSEVRGLANELTGGDAQTNQLLAESPSFVPAAEIDDINSRLGKKGSVRGAIRDLLEMRAKHAGTEGSRPLINGAAPAHGTSAAFTNVAEWQQARTRVRNGTGTDIDKQRIMATPDAGPS